MIGKIWIFLLFVAQLFDVLKAEDVHSREKRFLVVPPTSPTRHQLISGIGIPLNLENEAITLGLVLKAQYFLPENVNQLKTIYFPDIFGNYTPVNYAETLQKPFPLGRRKRETVTDKLTGQKYEKYEAEVQEIGNEELKESSDSNSDYYDESFDDEFSEDEKIPKPQDFPNALEEELSDTSGARWLMYDGLGKLLSSKGLQGRPCVLRGICEAAETKFTHHSGLFGELLHIIFTPSLSHDPIVNQDHHDYKYAEILGDTGEPCAEIFHECKNSLMDIFTQVQDSKLFKFF